MEKELKLLQSKLRRPVHISFISEYILDKDIDTTRKIINELKVNVAPKMISCKLT